MSPFGSRRPSAGGLAKLTAISALGAERAAVGLSDLLGREIRLEATGVHFGSTGHLLDLIGGEDAVVVGVYLSMRDGIEGHVMLLFELAQAYALVDQLLEQPAGTTVDLDEMSTSALGEVGNITAAAFLNEMGDAITLQIHPSPPTVVVELAGALLNTLVAEVAALGGEMMLVETVLHDAAAAFQGYVVITPNPDGLELLLSRLGEAEVA